MARQVTSDDRGLRARRQGELGRFLTAARSRLTPQAVGLPATSRRRTPGLRREEVAGLAGVSPVWYTWLEQGRDVQVSESVLAAVGRALRLTGEEWDFVHQLGRPTELLDPPSGLPRAEMHDLLHSLPAPAIRTDRGWTVIDCNAAATELFGFCSTPSPEPANLVRLLFVSGVGERTFTDWPAFAPAIVSLVRISYARHPADHRLMDLIDDVRARSAEFAGLWDEHRVDLLPLARFGVLDRTEASTRDYEMVPMHGGGRAGWNLLVCRPLGPAARRPSTEVHDLAS